MKQPSSYLILLLWAALLAGGCTELSSLRYGTFLLESGRYQEAHAQLEQAFSIDPSETTRDLYITSARKWSDELFRRAEEERVHNREERALKLLIAANDIYAAPKIVNRFTQLDEKLRIIASTRQRLELFKQQERFIESAAEAKMLLSMRPLDPGFMESFTQAKQRAYTQTLARGMILLRTGDYHRAYGIINQAAGLLFLRPPASSACSIPPGQGGPASLQQADRPPASRNAFPDLEYSLYDETEHHAQSREAAEALHLTERAIETAHLLAEAEKARAGGNLETAYRLFGRSRFLCPQLADLPFQTARFEKQLAQETVEAMQAAFFAGDMLTCLTLFKAISTTRIPASLEVIEPWRRKLQKVLRETAARQVSEGLHGNALLLIGSSQEVFPGFLSDLEGEARRRFLHSLLTIKVVGPGSAHAAACLAESGIPVSSQGELIVLHVEKPELNLLLLSPSYGFESVKRPGSFISYPHPERAKLLETLKKIETRRAAPHASQNPWEKEMEQVTGEFWEKKRASLKCNITQLDAVSWRFQWYTERVKTVYMQLHAELALTMTILPPGGSRSRAYQDSPLETGGGPGAADQEAKNQETITAEHSYTAHYEADSASEDPRCAGDLPSRNEVLSELQPVLKEKFLDRVKEMLCLALEEKQHRAAQRAQAGEREAATEMLCKICIFSRSAFKNENKTARLLSKHWGETALDALCPASNAAEKPQLTEHELPPPSDK